MARIRVDLFLSMIPAVLITYPILTSISQNVDGIVNHFIPATESISIPQGEVGSPATSDIPRLSSLNEILATDGSTFTIEMKQMSYINSALPINGQNYSWTLLKLPDDHYIPALINTENNKLDSTSEIITLPIGTLVKENISDIDDPQVESTMKSVQPDLSTNYYIDMGKEATKSSFNTLSKFSQYLGIFGFAIVIFIIGLTLIFHAIAHKLGLFPPLFTPKSRR